MTEVKVMTVEIKIGEKTIKLSIEQASELKGALNDFFLGPVCPVVVPVYPEPYPTYPTYPIYPPCQPYPSWTFTTGETNAPDIKATI